MNYNEKLVKLFDELGSSKKMVLSTSLNNIVTSRMMSVVILNNEFFFQTDITLRKYEQIKGNKNVALCVGNVQIEGICEEVGHTFNNEEFIIEYKKSFLPSYNKYTNLKNERLFKVIPTRIERWTYIEGIPYMEVFDVIGKEYKLILYKSE